MLTNKGLLVWAISFALFVIIAFGLITIASHASLVFHHFIYHQDFMIVVVSIFVARILTYTLTDKVAEKIIGFFKTK